MSTLRSGPSSAHRAEDELPEGSSLKESAGFRLVDRDPVLACRYFRTRTCTECGCYLRMTNSWEICDPCALAGNGWAGSMTRRGHDFTPRVKAPSLFETAL
jgi:hypothetical protein